MKLSNFVVGSLGDLTTLAFLRFFNHKMTKSQNHSIGDL
jgi:hypothetical protein